MTQILVGSPIYAATVRNRTGAPVSERSVNNLSASNFGFADSAYGSQAADANQSSATPRGFSFRSPNMQSQFFGNARYGINPRLELAEGGLVKEAVETAKHVPFGALRFVIKELPDGVASVPYAAIGLPKLASIGLNKLVGTPVLPYNAKEVSGLGRVERGTAELVRRARELFGVPEPEPLSKEYFAELGGMFAVPTGGIAKALKGGASMMSPRGALAAALDFGAMPTSLPGKGLTAGLYTVADALSAKDDQ